MHMDDLALKFTKQNRGKDKVTSYCFWCETLPDKNGNTKITVYIWKGCIKCLFSLGMVSSLA